MALSLSACDFTPKINKEILRAQGFVGKRQYTEAVALYEKLLFRGLNNEMRIKVFYQLGELYSIYLNNGRKAVSYFEKVVQLSDDPLWSVKAKERIGEISLNFTKDYGKSAEAYAKLKNFYPKLEKADFYEFNYAMSVFNMDDLEAAQKNFQKLADNLNHKYHHKAIYYLGLIEYRYKHWDKAIAYWKEYIKQIDRKEDAAQVTFLIANAFETMEELKPAYDLYFSILNEYPNPEVIRNRLNSIYNRRLGRKR